MKQGLQKLRPAKFKATPLQKQLGTGHPSSTVNRVKVKSQQDVVETTLCPLSVFFLQHAVKKKEIICVHTWHVYKASDPNLRRYNG